MEGIINTGYDIVGDIHGHAQPLTVLLSKLGYKIKNKVWHHPERQAIFLGDFIDRGPHQDGVIAIVRPMVESGSALAVMGNHEFNAISFYTARNDGSYLRERSEKNIRQHQAFLARYERDPAKWEDVIAWFKTLPLWLDLPGLRIVHACWDSVQINKILAAQDGSNYLTDQLLHAANDKNTWQYHAVDTLLKGKEIDLPKGMLFHDKDGTPRQRIRVKWWDNNGTTYRKAFLGPENAVTHIPDDPISGDHLIEYSHTAKPVFIGHYWLEGTPVPIATNIACVDYSVARGGKLVAYRWDGEATLSQNKFVSVGSRDSRMDDPLIVELATGLTAGLSCSRIDHLVTAAQKGFRLYELFRLTGPEELLVYTTVEVVAQEHAQRPDWWPDVWWQEPWPLYWSQPVSRPPWRSSYSNRDAQDPPGWTASGLDAQAAGLAHRRWLSILSTREMVRTSTDTLVQTELGLIDTHQHPNDLVLRDPNLSKYLTRHFDWYPIRDFPAMAYPLLVDLLAHPDINGFSHRGMGDWHAIKLACAEQIRREGAIPCGESELFLVSVLASWSGNSQFDYDDGHRISLNPYPAWTQGVRFQFEGLTLRNLFLDTGGCGAKPMAMNEHEQYEECDERILVLLTLPECRHPSNQRIWYHNESGFLAGVLPTMTNEFDALLRSHGMTPLPRSSLQ